MNFCEICKTPISHGRCPLCGHVQVINEDVTNAVVVQKPSSDPTSNLSAGINNAIPNASIVQDIKVIQIRPFNKNEKWLTFLSPINVQDGYGGTAIKIIEAFNRAGVKVKHFPVVHYRVDNLGEKFVEELTRYKDEQTRLRILYAQPTLVNKFYQEGRNLVAMTMFETTKIPQTIGSDWIDGLNKVKLVFTPSEFCKQVFEDCGVKTKIIVLPFGIDPEEWKYNKPKPKNKFVFLTTSAYCYRKNTRNLIRAFRAEFRNNNDVELWVKGKFDESYYRINDKKVKFIDKGYPDITEYRKLYEDCDCFVFPSRGEGIGMPPLQAMAIGRPVIATNWGGTKDYMNPEFSYPLNIVGFEKVLDYEKFMGDVGDYCIPDMKEFRKLMRYVYEHKQEAFEKGKKANKYVLENRIWDKVIDKMIKELEVL